MRRWSPVTLRRIPALLALAGLVAAVTPVALVPAGAVEPKPAPGSPAYVARDLENIEDAYGRITGPGGQLANPAYLPALVTETTALSVAQLLLQVANPTRPALTAGNVFPGWNVGNPLRGGWNGTRGLSKKVAFTNRYGALLRGTVYRPREGPRHPYTGTRLQAPFPGLTGYAKGGHQLRLGPVGRNGLEVRRTPQRSAQLAQRPALEEAHLLECL